MISNASCSSSPLPTSDRSEPDAAEVAAAEDDPLDAHQKMTLR